MIRSSVLSQYEFFAEEGSKDQLTSSLYGGPRQTSSLLRSADLFAIDDPCVFLALMEGCLACPVHLVDPSSIAEMVADPIERCVS